MNILKKLIGGITVAIAATCLTGCINFGGTYANADKYLVGTQYYDGELTTLDIDWNQGKVTLIQDETAEHITVREDNELPDGKKVHSYFVDGTLYVKFCESGYIYTNVFSQDKQLFVTFPKLENLDLDISSGEAVIGKIDGKKIDVKVTSGDIKIEQATAETFICHTTSGKINIGDVTCDTFTSKTTSGTITVDSLNTKEGTMKSTSGSITANVKTADKLTINITSGNLDLTLPEAGATVKLHKTSGSFKSTREHTEDKGTYIFGDGSCAVSIDITSGNVVIR